MTEPDKQTFPLTALEDAESNPITLTVSFREIRQKGSRKCVTEDDIAMHPTVIGYNQIAHEIFVDLSALPNITQKSWGCSYFFRFTLTDSLGA